MVRRSKPSPPNRSRQDIPALLAAGLAHHRARRLAEAERCYQRVLRADPSNADALNLLGALAGEAQQMQASIDFLERALRARPSDPEIRNNLGQSYLRHERPLEALAHFEAAATAMPQATLPALNRARALRALGRADDALAAFQAISVRDPSSLAARIGAADTLLDLGRIDEAVAAYRAVIAADQTAVDAHAGLAVAQRFAPGDPEPAAMAALLETGGLAPTERRTIHLALAKAFDDLADPDTAFAHASAAKRAVPRQFDQLAYSRFVDAQIARFGPDVFAGRTARGHSSDAPVFIVGMPRSGTTLVEQIVASHPEGAGAGEFTDLQRIAIDLYTRAAAARTGPAAGPFQLPGHELRRAAGTYLAALSARANAPGATRLADKTPQNFEHLGLVALLFPNARIIHCRRDARDTCLSIYMHAFRDSHAYGDDLVALARYYRDYERLMAHWRAVLPLAIVDVDYADLVAEPQATIRTLIAGLGLAWHEGCLAFHESRRAVTTPSRAQIRRPVYRSSQGRWRRYEAHLQPLLEALEKD
ncbi:MAG: tetratricopeptide repeat protein [Rhizobiales bacterium]|nr:tetratricopeptide repeat protein [Hyphomicrobiales bacterium]